MRPKNQTHVSEFLFLGLPNRPEQQGMFFVLFLGIYLTTVLGNLLIILLIRLDPRPHNPCTSSSATWPSLMSPFHLSSPRC